MRDWPPIDEPELLARLALSDEEFFAAAHKLAAAWGAREYKPEYLTRALAYPWDRPKSSYLLRHGEVSLLSELDPAQRQATIAAFTADRHPIVAFGGNAAPGWLTTKFAHFPAQEDKDILVLAGELQDIDVGASASVSPMGNMPGTLFASPGTAVSATMIWCTTTQITQLTWTEIPYLLGRLDDAVFSMDEADVEVEDVFAYVSRFGAFCVEGTPIALAAIPARNRTATALTQEELLDLVAPWLVADGARAGDLVRAAWEDLSGIYARAAETVWRCSLQLQAPWTPYPAAGPDA